jgi:tetratricopeptide (TPR) repeat protein
MSIKKFINLVFTLLLGLFILSGCSTENNTFINRTYHSTTAKYNGYFNANELIKTSLSTYRENVKEDFYDILPVESVPNEKEIGGMLPSIDTAIVKCTKVIRNHCMPSMERPEGKKVEYNNWIDENWNLIGQAYYLKRDYELSTKNFEFVKELFKNDKSTYIARIWIIKNKIALGKMDEAKALVLEMDEIIEKQEKADAENQLNFIQKTKKIFAKKDKKSAKNPPKVPKSLKADYNFTKASYYIAEEDFNKAIEALEKGIKQTKDKQSKIRGHFILGQLYSKKKNPENAKQHFNLVVKSPGAPFEMQFNARINRAFLGRDEKVKKELTKLLNDEKNAEYRDQIYYALADIAMQERNKIEAINLLHKSTYYSTNNKRQQAVSYERLGSISYQDKQYVKAQKYFDSCANVMPENYPNEIDVRKKASKLKKLVECVTIVETQDSLLRIAAMNDKDRENYIKKSIKKIKEDAARKEREEKAKMQAKLAKQIAEDQNNPNSNKWYWNNAKTKADGFSEFKKNWGNRENTDDWRRNDKIVLTSLDTTTKSKATVSTQEETDTLTVEYLSKNLPFTKKAKDDAMSKLISAEYDAGLIYKEQLNEGKLASDCFQDILSRKYTSNFNLLASFQLFKMYDGKDNGKATQQRTYILTNYPNSDYANYLRDPNFFLKQKEQEKKNEEYYLTLLEKYRQRKYSEVIIACEGAEVNEKLNSKFLLLQSLAIASSTENKQSIIPILTKITKEYPNSPESIKAKEMLEILEKGYSKYAPVVFKKEFPFVYEEGESLWIIIFLDKNNNSNAAKNKISLFNDNSFDKIDIAISSKLYEQDQSVVILKSFTQTEGENYIKTFKEDSKNIKEYKSLPIYMISQDNLKLLFENKNLDVYKDFYQEYFK